MALFGVIVLTLLLSLLSAVLLQLAGQEQLSASGAKDTAVAQHIADAAADMVMAWFHSPQTSPAQVAPLLTKRQEAATGNPSFRTEEYELDLKLVRDLADHFDVVMLAKAGEAYGAPEIRDLSAVLVGLNHRMTIQPIIEHPKSLKIAPELMQYSTVKHVVFGIHDFSKAMGIAITPRNWPEELKFYLHDLLFEARIAGKGVIGAVETLIGDATMPEEFVEPHDVRRWLDLHGDEETRVVYRHACEEASMGLSGKQVIHPSHIHPCKVAFTPSPSEIRTKIAILEAAIEADALLGGAIKFEGEMLDPPMFGKALQTLLRAHALHALSPADTDFAMDVLKRLVGQNRERSVRSNCPPLRCCRPHAKPWSCRLPLEHVPQSSGVAEDLERAERGRGVTAVGE